MGDMLDVAHNVVLKMEFKKQMPQDKILNLPRLEIM